MRRCTSCFRFSIGHPTYCSHCGRSYNVRVCRRGHVNARGATFCALCGSPDLSTPAPKAGVLFYLSQWALQLAAAAVVLIFLLILGAAIAATIDWSAVTPRLMALALALGALYWTTTLLPGPVKRLGKIAGSAAVRAVTHKRNGNSRRHGSHENRH